MKYDKVNAFLEDKNDGEEYKTIIRLGKYETGWESMRLLGIFINSVVY